MIDGTTVEDRAYSVSKKFTAGRNQSAKIAFGTATVPHNANGKKSIAAGKISATCSSGGIVATQTVTSDSKWDLTEIPRASTITTTAASNLMGTVRTITINRASSSFTHTLTYSFGSASGMITTKTSSTSVSWPVPKSLAAQVASGSVQRTGTITCETFNGNTSVGTSTASFTAVIPPSTVAADSSSVTMGSSLGFTITRAANTNNLTHTLTYKFGSATGTIGSSLTTSASWATSASLASEVEANNSSGSGTVTLTTYNGSATVGTSTAYFTLKIPASTFTRSTATVTMGGTQTFTITRAASNITHKLTYAFGSLTNQTIGTGIGTSKSWTVPTSLASQISNASQGTVTVALTTYNGTAVCGSTSTLTFTAKAPASTMTLSSTSVYIGTGSTTVTINRAATNMTHTLEYKFSTDADSAYASIGSNLTTSKVWDSNSGLTYSLASKIPSAPSGSWTLRLTTKIGSATVGTSTKTLTLKVPNNPTMQPTISSPVTLAPYSSLSSPFNTIFIANYTRLRATITASGKQSATISSYSVTVDGKTISQSTSPVTTANNLTTSGTITVTIKVTDSRGFAKSTTQTITVYEYNEPSVTPKTGQTKVICGRSNSSGTLSASGTYLHIEAGRLVSTLNGNNKGSLKYEVFDASETSLETGWLLGGAPGAEADTAWTSSTALVSDLTSTYSVVLTAYDTFGNSSVFTASIPTDSVTLHLARGGGAVGVGMYAQGWNRVDIAWPTYIAAGIYPRVINSHDAGASSGYYTRMLVVPRYTADDILSGAPDTTPPYETYFRAWLTKICQDYGLLYGAANLLVTGVAEPSTRFLAQGNIYNVSDTVSGLPRHCSFAAYPEGTGMTIIRFGTYEGTWYAEEYFPNGVKTGTLTYVSNSVITSAANLGITLRKSGKVVTMDFAPTVAAVSGGSSTVKVAQIADSSFYPQNRVALTVPQQASSFYYCGVYVTTGGEIQILKNNTSSTTVRANLSWITA